MEGESEMKQKIGRKFLSLGICMSFFAFLAIGGIIPCPVRAATTDFIEAGIHYGVLDDGKAVGVTGADADITTLDVPETVTDSSTGTKYQVTTVENGAFWGNSTLTTVRLADSVINLETDAFHDCENISSFTFSKESTTLGSWVFYNCKKLTSIDLSSISSMGSDVFNSAGLTSVTAPSIATLPDSIFTNCTALTSIKLPDCITKIGDYALNNTGITTVTLPSKLKEIGKNSFQGNNELTSLVIPSSVTAIDYAAFYGCPKLNSLSFLGKNPAAFGTEVFDGGTPLEEAFVPAGSAGMYRSLLPSFTNLYESDYPEDQTKVVTDPVTNISVNYSEITLPEGVNSVSAKISTLSQSGDSTYQTVAGLVGSENYSGLSVYDIQLLDQNGKTFEPTSGALMVRVPIPSGMSGKLRVFWYDPKTSTLNDMKAEQGDGFLFFQTKHFSQYAVVQPKSAPSPASSGTINPSSLPVSSVQNPKTGSGDYTPFLLVLFGAGTAAGILLALRNKHRKKSCERSR